VFVSVCVCYTCVYTNFCSGHMRHVMLAAYFFVCDIPLNIHVSLTHSFSHFSCVNVFSIHEFVTQMCYACSHGGTSANVGVGHDCTDKCACVQALYASTFVGGRSKCTGLCGWLSRAQSSMHSL